MGLVVVGLRVGRAARLLLLLLVALAAADHAGPDGARLLEAVQDLAHAAVRHLELAADVARPHPVGRHLDDAPAHVVRQRAPVDEEAAQLVDAALALVGVGAVVVGQEGPEGRGGGGGRERGHHGHCESGVFFVLAACCLARLLCAGIAGYLLLALCFSTRHDQSARVQWALISRTVSRSLFTIELLLSLSY